MEHTRQLKFSAGNFIWSVRAEVESGSETKSLNRSSPLAPHFLVQNSEEPENPQFKLHLVGGYDCTLINVGEQKALYEQLASLTCHW